MGHDKGDRTTELNSTADTHTKKVIPYKEYTAQREAERRASTASKSTSGEEQNWDEEPPLPPGETPHQELYLWHHPKKMSGGGWSIRIPALGQSLGIQDMAQWLQLGKMNPSTALKNFVGVMGGVNESVTAEYLSDVEWRDDDPLFMFNDENVTKLQTPAATSTPVRTCEE